MTLPPPSSLPFQDSPLTFQHNLELDQIAALIPPSAAALTEHELDSWMLTWFQ